MIKDIKPNYKVHPKDVITVLFPEPPRDTEVVPENIPLDIVYEDAYLMVINKPAGMVVHPAYQNWTGTLVNALTYHFQNLPQLPGNDGRPGLVHRIDKDTSGLLVIAKEELTLNGLAKQFFDHTIERKYYALVWGVPRTFRRYHQHECRKKSEGQKGHHNFSKGRHGSSRHYPLQGAAGSPVCFTD